MSRFTWLAVGMAALAIAGAACRGTPARAAERPVVDSALPREATLARFRQGLDSVAGLSGGAASQAALARAWAAALEHRDTLTLRRLVLDRAEFAWLFYPTSPQGLPPYALSPELLWEMLGRQTERGIDHELRVFGGAPLGFQRIACGDTPSVEGENRVWGPCVISYVRSAGDTVSARLTGPVIERNGRFKFVSYTNSLD